MPNRGFGGQGSIGLSDLTSIPSSLRGGNSGPTVETTDLVGGSRGVPVGGLGYNFVGPGLAFGTTAPDGTQLAYPTYSFYDRTLNNGRGGWQAVAQDRAGNSAQMSGSLAPFGDVSGATPAGAWYESGFDSGGMGVGGPSNSNGGFAGILRNFPLTQE